MPPLPCLWDVWREEDPSIPETIQIKDQKKWNCYSPKNTPIFESDVEAPAWPEKPLYMPLDANNEKIRLLTILPAQSFDAVIKCRLHTSCLQEVPRYTALSYTWGDPNLTENIMVDSLQMSVTANLASALREIRSKILSRPEDKFFWIDSLCIIQHDIQERRQQVMMTKSIYERASAVLVWLEAEPLQSLWDQVRWIEPEQLSQGWNLGCPIAKHSYSRHTRIHERTMYRAAGRKRKTWVPHRVDCFRRVIVKTAAGMIGFTSATVATAFSIHRGGLAAEARLRCHGFQPSVCGVQNGVLDTIRSDCTRFQSKEWLDGLSIYIKMTLPNSHTLSTGTDALLFPSSVEFAIAIVLLPFCAAIIHTLFAIGQTRYQQWVIVALPCGAIVGALLGLKLQEIVFIFLPWYWILITLLLELASIFLPNRIETEKLRAEISIDGVKGHDDLRNGRLYFVRTDSPSTPIECPACLAACSTPRERLAHILVHRGDGRVVKELCSDFQMFDG